MAAQLFCKSNICTKCVGYYIFEANKLLVKPLFPTEIQRRKWNLPEEQPPSSGTHQTSALLAFSHHQPGVRLPSPGRIPGSLQPEHEQQTIQTRGRPSGGRGFLQWVHHSHPRPQTGGRFHRCAFRKPWKVQRRWERDAEASTLEHQTLSWCISSACLNSCSQCWF